MKSGKRKAESGGVAIMQAFASDNYERKGEGGRITSQVPAAFADSCGARECRVATLSLTPRALAAPR